MVDSTSGQVSSAPGEGYPLVVIVGPTASGKSALALALAERWGGEIVNYDSVQVYKGFNLGSGKLAPEERRGIPHHLLDCVEPGRLFTAGDYAREASRALQAVRTRGTLAILVGGTGLYLRALLVGLFEGPRRSEELRARLAETAHRRGREFLHRMLRRLDPASARRMEPRDAQKVIRALEVCFLTRRPLSDLLKSGRKGLEGFQAFKIGLSPDRAQLDLRINRRVEQMFRSGLIEETRQEAAKPALAAASSSGGSSPLGALGYRQSLAVVRGEMSEAEALEATQAATRQYAKRQRTWFRREPEVVWFSGFGDDPLIQRQVAGWLENCLSPFGFQPDPCGKTLQASEGS